jgi:hypothetical protein
VDAIGNTWPGSCPRSPGLITLPVVKTGMTQI